MADMVTADAAAADEAVVAAVEVDEDMVEAVAAKTRITIIIAMSMKPRRVTVQRHLLVEMGTMFLRV
jgi:hypothetical protein